jgi:hypothetical protein
MSKVLALAKDWQPLIAIIAAIITVAAVMYGVANQFLSLEHRVSDLEKQVNTLTVAPTIRGAGGREVSNPVAQACAELAQKSADPKAGFNDSERAKDAMKELGCIRASEAR